MITRLTLENFMSHTRTVIEPSSGLTVITGPNNCGKSAVVEAIAAVCENTKTDFMVRHDAKEAVVTIETDDGHTIVWRRRKLSASYTLDGERNDRPTPDYLDQVQKLLRLPSVRDSDGNAAFQVHLGTQKSPIFLLNETGSKQATFFASSSDAEKLLEMQRLHRSRVADDKKTQARLTQEITALDGQLLLLQPLEPLTADADGLAREYDALRNAAATVERVASLTTAIQRRDSDRVKQVLLLKAAESLSPPPTGVDDGVLSRHLDRANRVERRHSEIQTSLKAMSSLVAPPTPLDIQTLDNSVARLKKVRFRHDTIETAVAAMHPLRSPAPAIDIAPLQQSAMALKRAEDGVGHAKRSLSAAAMDLLALRDEIEHWIAANPKCPTCNGDLAIDQVLSAGGHAHG